MLSAALVAQSLKITAGVAQVGFALGLLIRGPRSASNVAFATSFGANGIAYALFNVSPPGHRGAGSLALEGRAIFNWIAAGAMIVFVTAFLQSAGRAGRRRVAWLVGVSIALAMGAAAAIAAQAYGLNLLEFGGIAIYPASALALAVFPLVFRGNTAQARTDSAFLGAALGINSVDHLGAELVRPGPSPEATVLIQIVAMSIILGLWLWNAVSPNRIGSQLALLVIFCLIAPFVAGVLVRVAAGSYAGVQRSGFIGIGRLATTGLLAYGMVARGAFSSHADVS